MFYSRILAILSITSLIAASAHEDGFEYEDNVLVITERNIDNVLEQKGYLVVDFYSDWCLHCVGLARHWIHIAKLLKEKNSTVTMAKANCGVEKELKARFKITDYPTVMIMKKNRIWEYEGKRGLDEILSWIEEKTEVKAKLLSSANEIEIFRDSANAVVIAALLGNNTEEKKTYLSAAQDYDKVLFGEVKDLSVAKSMGISDKGIVIFKRLMRHTYDGSLTDEVELKRWLLKNTWVLLQEMNDETAPEIFDDAIEIHNILFMKKSNEMFEKIYSSFEDAASEFIGQVRFVFVDAGDHENDRVMEFFGVKKETCPTYRVINMNDDMAKYMPKQQDLSSAAVANFTRSVYSGKAKRYLSTQEIPEDWNKYPVIELVGKNFEETAYDSSKKVFVYFYDPWCIHCKKANEMFKELGEYYKDNPNVVIAQMDATTNEVEDIKIISFPTFKYFPPGASREFHSYEGDRSLEAVIHYIETNGGMESLDDYYSDQTNEMKPDDNLRRKTDSAGSEGTPTTTSEEHKDSQSATATEKKKDTLTDTVNNIETPDPETTTEKAAAPTDTGKSAEDPQKDKKDVSYEYDEEKFFREYEGKTPLPTPEEDMMRELEKILSDTKASGLPNYDLPAKLKEKLKLKQKEEL